MKKKRYNYIFIYDIFLSPVRFLRIETATSKYKADQIIIIKANVTTTTTGKSPNILSQ